MVFPRLYPLEGPKGCSLIASGTLKCRELEDCTGRSSSHSAWSLRKSNWCLLTGKPVFSPSFLVVSLEKHFLSHACIIKTREAIYSLVSQPVGWCLRLTVKWLSEKGQEQNILSYKIKKSLGLHDRFLLSQFGNSSLQLKVTVKKKKGREISK